MLSRELAHNCNTLGLLLVPNILDQTPAYVDAVVDDSPAAKSGLLSDDLILMIDRARIDNQNTLEDQLRRIDRRDPVKLLIQRGTQILPITLTP